MYLTDNIQIILEAVRNSSAVEVQVFFGILSGDLSLNVDMISLGVFRENVNFLLFSILSFIKAVVLNYSHCLFIIG